jgi:two-component system, cell cycle sensor histidine kinase and response regulator CckA
MPGSLRSTGLPTLSSRAGVLLLVLLVALVAALARATFDTGAVLFLLVAFASVVAGVGAWLLHRDIRAREAALERSEERYRTLFERNVMGVALADEEARCLEANQAFARMLGVPDRRELEGEELPRLLGGELPPPGVVREASAVRGDGEPVRLVYCWGPLREDEGEAGMLLSAVDVTAEHRGRERLRAVVHMVGEGVLTIDGSGRIRFANAAARRILDLTDADVGTASVFGPRWELATLEGERLDPDADPAARVLRDGEPVEEETVVLRRPDGSTAVLRVNAASLGDVPALRAEVVVTLRDVTGQVEQVRSLEESVRLHRSVVNHVGQVIFQTDRDRNLTFLNAAWEELTKRPVSESLGTDFLDHVHPEDVEMCRWEIDRLMTGRSRYCRHEVRIRSEGGDPRWVEVRARLATEGEERAGGTAGVLVDVTDRREMEERVARARKMEAMGQLAGGVAHDFNNLLTVILGYAQLIQGEVEEDPRVPVTVRESAYEIFRMSQKAAGLTRQLLTFSRQQVLDRRVLSPNDVIRRYDHFLRRFLPAAITCEIHLDPDLAMVEMSPTHLEQALLNLVLNARDALEREPHGRMTVRTWNERIEDPVRAAKLGITPGRYVAIQIADTGCGMDPATQERIFEPFFSTKAKDQGSGMGLAAVYGIVSQAGGAVDVRSAPGQGSSFTVYLPEVESPSALPD